MNQRSIVIATVLATTMLTAVFTTTPPFSLKSAEGQTIVQCPAGYVRDPSGICVPITRPPAGTSENRTEQDQIHVNSGEQNIVCSGLSYTCG